MGKNISADFSREIFQIMLQIPHIKVRHTDGLTRSSQILLVMLKLTLDETRDSLMVTEISNLLKITPAGVTHLINPLEESGYVKRLQDAKDRRIVRIGLTEKGSQEAVASIMVIENYMGELVNLLGDEDSKIFIRLLSRVIAHFTS